MDRPTPPRTRTTHKIVRHGLSALATIRVYEEDHLLQNARDLGVIMKEILADLEKFNMERFDDQTLIVMRVA